MNRYSVIIIDPNIDHKAFGEKWLKTALMLTRSNKKVSDYKMTIDQKDNNTFEVIFILKKGRRRK